MMVTISAWLMATLTTSVLMVALVQTASTLPSLLFGLFAGALADLSLAVITLNGLLTPYVLLVFTFIVGTGFAFYLPAQLASVNELVSQEELPRAIALNAVAFNVSRAVGPALAGAVATWQGSGTSLLVSSFFLTFMVIALIGWQTNQRPPGVPEKLLSGVKSGLRYTRHSTQMRSLIGRTLAFSICASALWALLPVIARSLMAVQASLAIGSALWGWMANWTGTQVTLVTSAILLMVLHVLYRSVQVRLGNEADVTPFGHLPEMALTAEPNADDGPVLVQLEYTITPEDREDFLEKIKRVEATRRRNGATDWRVFRDLSTEGRFVERFIITSWAEYIRSRVRMTVADRRIQSAVAEMHNSEKPIRISRFLGV